MRSWICVPESPGGRPGSRWLAVLSGSTFLTAILLLVAPASAAPWTLSPRLSLSGGSESDLILDPNVDGAVVDAGSFVDLRPELVATARYGAATRLRLSTQAALERYFDSGQRRIYAQSVAGEFLHLGPRGLRTRAFVSGDFFDDSERTTVRRLGSGAGAGAGWFARRGGVEVTASWSGRRYLELETVDDSGRLGTYSESSWSVGANALWTAGRWWVRPEVGFRSTDARDPLFDATSWMVGLRARCELSARMSLVATALRQSRSFDQRLASEDQDEYVQAGLGADVGLTASTEGLARMSFVRYTRTTGEDEDTRRFEIGLRYRFGGGVSSSPLRAALARTRAGSAAVPPPGRLRFYIPGVSQVRLAGDFNGWSVSGDQLTSGGDGWWEIDLDLPPGVYQYKLVVDGRWVVPDEAVRRVSDGFGGENALLEIAEKSS